MNNNFRLYGRFGSPDPWPDLHARQSSAFGWMLGLIVFIAIAMAALALAQARADADCVEWAPGPITMQCINTSSFSHCEQVESRRCVRHGDSL